MPKALYDNVLKITEEYIGQTAPQFLNRQILSHLGKKPHEITAKDIPQLEEWLNLSLALLTPDERLLNEFSSKLESLAHGPTQGNAVLGGRTSLSKVTEDARYKVGLLNEQFIYVEKIGDQTEASMLGLYKKVKELAAELRKQDKEVLVLSNAEKEGAMDEAARAEAIKIGKELDYDKSATYTSSQHLHNLRDVMAKTAHLDQKVANFDTKAEAVAWLMLA